MQKPEKTTGVKHIIEAIGYSYAGFKRMMKEAAFRLNIIFITIILGVLCFFDASSSSILTACILGAILQAIEVLNTAIEEIVDHLSPDYSEFAKVTKDLGSFAVFIITITNIAHALYAIII